MGLNAEAIHQARRAVVEFPHQGCLDLGSVAASQREKTCCCTAPCVVCKKAWRMLAQPYPCECLLIRRGLHHRLRCISLVQGRWHDRLGHAALLSAILLRSSVSCRLCHSLLIQHAWISMRYIHIIPPCQCDPHLPHCKAALNSSSVSTDRYPPARPPARHPNALPWLLACKSHATLVPTISSAPSNRPSQLKHQSDRPH